MVVACGLAKCGRITGDDGGLEAGDAPSAACATGEFGAATAIAELNTDDDERGLRFTADELLAVFSRTTKKDDASLQKPVDVYSATRTVRSAALSSPVVTLAWQGGVLDWAQLYPSVTSDARSLFVESSCEGQTTPNASMLCLAKSDGVTAGFVGPTPMLLLAGGFGFGPFGAGFSFGDGFVTGDGGTYYFMSLINADGGFFGYYADSDAAAAGQALFIAHQIPSDTPPTPFQDPALRVAIDTPLVVDNPVLTDDELTLFVSTTTPSDPTPHVATTTRATLTDGFGPLTPLHALDSAEGEYPTWISPDRCRLYMTRTVGGQSDLFVASRTQ